MEFNILITISTLLIITVILSYGLTVLQNNLQTNDQPIIQQINNYLPQTQCGQCDYPGCKPYAIAISQGEADINRCPPGGIETINNLAQLLNIPKKPLAADLKQTPTINTIAKINEAACIGCALCIKACPVDAIVGADNMLHTVITAQCTGCALCIAPCPVDCINMIDSDVK